ncbi:MAG: hypothetical protein K8R34_08790 [Methanosarcinales archaeon]|nr:hypothetical protein [Methanosarcinales archaeon]
MHESPGISAIEPAAHLYLNAHAACVWSEHRKRGRCESEAFTKAVPKLPEKMPV